MHESAHAVRDKCDGPISLERSYAELGTVSGTPARWGPFRLIAKVGQGGFGEVFKAFDPELQREVAVKLLMPKPGRHDEEDLIIREARLHCRIRHNNVVAVHGAG